ncbi:FAD/NAD(P)-binding domain-containing protein [Mycena kentingensis (nom. inval.)]|nr:FAD/NAD(P)-binding domain-containing protein [Mycena kentingensis (nom. inval.)]
MVSTSTHSASSFSAPLPSTADTCIVGAGPSGLAVALGLAVREIPFVIVDALEAGHNGSRAIGVFPNALEALNTVSRELVDDIMAAGIISTSTTCLDAHGKTLMNFRFDAALDARTEFPFYVIIQQHRVEALMRAYLARMGTNIHWGKRVTSLRAVNDGTLYALQLASGETLEAKYVVAADGAKSALREAAGIRYLDPHTGADAIFEGKDDWRLFVVADVVFDPPAPSSIPRDRVQSTIGRGGLVMTAPIPGEEGEEEEDEITRLYLGVPGSPPPADPDAAYLQSLVDAHGAPAPSPPSKPKIARVLDSARYRVAVALAERYLARATADAGAASAYILLAGDAAHRQGPAGGQGMNLGICEGLALAEAICAARMCALTTANRHPESEFAIFNEYATRRREIAREVMGMVRNMTALEDCGSGLVDYLRMKVVSALCGVELVEKRMVWRVSEEGVDNIVSHGCCVGHCPG